MKVLEQALGGVAGGMVLDVATGEGDFIRTLVANLEGFVQIIGVDIIKHTRATGSIFHAKDVRFMLMDAERLGFGNESLDTVSISSSLHHLKHIAPCLAEMKRVLRPGGHIIIRETHRDIQAEPQLMDMHIHHWVAKVDSALGFTHNTTFSRQELKDLVEGLGLRHLEFYDVPNSDLDPMDEAAIRESEEVLARYMRRAERLPSHRALERRGKELQRRLREVGIQWEPELVVIGEKP
jgi:SAM-dependent methyltransferase